MVYRYNAFTYTSVQWWTDICKSQLWGPRCEYNLWMKIKNIVLSEWSEECHHFITYYSGPWIIFEMTFLIRWHHNSTLQHVNCYLFVSVSSWSSKCGLGLFLSKRKSIWVQNNWVLKSWQVGWNRYRWLLWLSWHAIALIIWIGH